MKIFVWGSNYPLDNKPAFNPFPNRGVPYLYMKPDSALLKDGKPFFLPDFLTDVCASAAVVVRLNRLGKSVPARFASRYYAEATVGVDLFARGDAGQLSSQGLPWDLAVGFDGSAVVGRFVPVAPVGEKNLAFELCINGQVVQSGSTDRLITGVDEGISFLSRYYILKTGDLVYTGSPGVPAPLRIGDRLEGYLDGEKLLDFHIR